MEPQRPSAASRNQNLGWSNISGAKEVLSSSGEPRWVSLIFGVARHELLGINDGMNTSLVPPAEPRVSPAFLSKYQPLIQGTLQGFDRLRLRGTLRHLFCPQVMEAYLSVCRVLIKDFGKFATGLTQKIKQAALGTAAQAGRPYQYLNSSQVDKGELAQQVAQRDGITEGLVMVIGCVEPCLSYDVAGDRQTKEIHLVLERRKCTHFYHYYQHPTWGLMHVRVQSWAPWSVDVCLNGRLWLARQMDAAGLAYRRQENCFVWVEDWQKAQALLDEQPQTRWAQELDSLLCQSHPCFSDLCRPLAQHYYWSASSTEYATDVVFKRPADLAPLYRQLLRHGMSTFASSDVMRFLGRRVPLTSGPVHGNFAGEIISDLKTRPEGVRIKHSLNGNTLKMYDKQSVVLRVETTIDHPGEFKIWRTSEKEPDGKLAWRELRRGVADLPRRCEVSAAANNRYLTALASVTGKIPLSQLTAEITRPLTQDGQRYRGLRPWSPEDGRWLEVLSRGEAVINGWRNRDFQRLLFPKEASAQEKRRRAAQVTRRLRLFRAHGLLRKVSGTHRYLVTEKGRQILTALLAARQADVDQLNKLAA